MRLLTHRRGVFMSGDDVHGEYGLKNGRKAIRKYHL